MVLPLIRSWFVLVSISQIPFWHMSQPFNVLTNWIFPPERWGFIACLFWSADNNVTRDIWYVFLKIPFPRWAGIKEFHPSGARNQLEAKREPTIKAGTSCSSKIERQLFRPILRENRAALFAHNFPPSAPLVFSYSSLPTRFFLLLPTCHYHHNISFKDYHCNTSFKYICLLKKFEGKKR